MAEYRVRDQSILGPYLMRFLVEPLLSRLPRTLSANALTLSGIGLSAGAVGLLMLHHPVANVAAALCTVGYAVLDNADGAHARRTGQSSPFGEFLDHHLDTFSGGFLGLGFAAATQLPLRWVLPLVCMMSAAFYASMLEQKVTGHLRLGRASQIEACALMATVYVSTAIFGVRWLVSPFFHGVHVVHLLFAWEISTCATVLVTTAVRMQAAPKADRTGAKRGLAWTVLIQTGYGLWAFLGDTPPLVLVAPIVLANAATSGRMVIARVVHDPMPKVDFAHVLVVAAGTLAALTRHDRVALVCAVTATAWLSVRVVLDVRLAVTRLRAHLRHDELLGRLFGGTK